MAQIKSLDVKSQRQEESFGFHKLMLIETAKCTDAKVVPLHQAYATAFAYFDEVLKPGGKDPMTALLLDLDNQRDLIYSGTAGQARNMIKHFDPDKAAIAKMVSDIIAKYGDPRALPYIQENGVIENLVQELKAYDNPGDDRPVIESTGIEHDRLSAIGLKEWVDKLEALNNQFILEFSNRNAAQSAVITGASKEARIRTDKAYQAVVKRINALIEVNGEADYIEIVNKMNELIDYQKATLAARSTRSANKKEDDRPAIE